jgi:hypothetical protein
MSERKSRRWTPVELSLLRQLVFDKKPLSAIAAALNRTALAVRTKAAQERLRPLDDVPSRGARESHGGR